MIWPLKTERGVVELARDNLDVEQIATKLNINPEAVVRIGRRLGIYFPPIKPKRTARRKTKGT
jgi:hypothetical protein